jgi:hypothetical protein
MLGTMNTSLYVRSCAGGVWRKRIGRYETTVCS